ncbi:MAG: MFS transporter [Planctomycetaceae bacterium]|nr:MFS transporter [Planctomycetaceae bacterium]MCB9951465.1 MFS transporter [Planctomycetaceae bacterium]
MNQLPAASRPKLTTVQWLICVMAAIGFAFDIYELLMLPLVAKEALLELGNIRPGTDAFKHWFTLLFYVPAMVGGIVGLWGGYLTDKLGRRRVLTWSIMLYAFSAFAAGFSTNLWMLLFFRTLTFVGVCVEFVAAVAWLAELFEDPEQREKVLGYTQAFSSIGGLLVAMVNGAIVLNAKQLPAIHLPEFLQLGAIAEAHASWRYTLMSGLLPAIPLLVIRPFLPESPVWAKKMAEGKLKRPSIAELFGPGLRTTTIVTTLMFMCSYGIAFGALQQLQQIVPGIDEVQAQIAEDLAPAKAKAAAATQELLSGAGVEKPEEWILSEETLAALPEETATKISEIDGGLKKLIEKTSKGTNSLKNAEYTKSQELGGLFGRFILAMLVVIIVSRRTLLRVFVLPGMIVMPIVFLMFAGGDETTFAHFDISFIPGFHDASVSVLGLAIFTAGFFTVAQFSFWGNYLPTVYPVHLRGTGESFAANIGGRMLGTSFMAVTQLLISPHMPGEITPGETSTVQISYAAAVVSGVLCLLSFILSFFLPEPKPEMED